ncbi:hypothetical protein G6F40_013915 [Rhizopus arrhizus]|nr:hypothetical protein G6F40_013915 [Rhizopus arrhizus]
MPSSVMGLRQHYSGHSLDGARIQSKCRCMQTQQDLRFTEGALPPDATPQAYSVRDVMRLDDEAMVWSESNAASRMESIMPVAALHGNACVRIGERGPWGRGTRSSRLSLRQIEFRQQTERPVLLPQDPESLLCCRRQAMPGGLEQRQALCPRRPRLGPARGAADDGSRPHGDLS